VNDLKLVLRARRGMTLIELLIAMTVFTIVLGVAVQFLLVQSTGFRLASAAVGAEQNLRFAAGIMRQDLVLAGANVPDQQPVLVYAGTAAVAFNADYATNLTTNVSAVFVDPNAPAGQVSALTFANRVAIPGSSPTLIYPDTSYTVAGSNSDAETIAFFFQLDTETPRTDDYVLRRQVNAGTPETIARGVLPFPGRPFLRYYRLESAGGTPTAVTVAPDAWLPLSHVRPVHLSPADTGIAARIDLLRAVEVSYAVTNGLADDQARTYQISFIVPLPNMGLAKLRSCGDSPILGQALTATLDVSTGSPQIRLAWNRATDEAQGERDVARYVLWRRIAGTASWGDPYLSLPAGNNTYLYVDAAVDAATSYEYALAAQDCTPNLSSRSVSAPVIVP
jgi:prepilin-type N-terminal cleavage/methylation domain-containing protein